MTDQQPTCFQKSTSYCSPNQATMTKMTANELPSYDNFIEKYDLCCILLTRNPWLRCAKPHVAHCMQRMFEAGPMTLIHQTLKAIKGYLFSILSRAPRASRRENSLLKGQSRCQHSTQNIIWEVSSKLHSFIHSPCESAS